LNQQTPQPFTVVIPPTKLDGVLLHDLIHANVVSILPTLSQFAATQEPAINFVALADIKAGDEIVVLSNGDEMQFMLEIGLMPARLLRRLERLVLSDRERLSSIVKS
jgi:hypothetical protein